jgi:hypothetical protein
MSSIIWKAGLINILRHNRSSHSVLRLYLGPDEESGQTLMPVHRKLASTAPAWWKIKLKKYVCVLWPLTMTSSAPYISGRSELSMNRHQRVFELLQRNNAAGEQKCELTLLQLPLHRTFQFLSQSSYLPFLF